MNVIKTNWINVVGVFLITLCYVFVNALLHSATLIQAAFGALLLVCAYGFMFWAGLIMALIVLDLILIVWDQRQLKIKLLAEWLTVSGGVSI